MEIICVGLKVKLTWVQDPRPSPKPSWRLSTHGLNISSRTKAIWNKITTHIIFLEWQSIWPTLNFYYEFSVGWELMWPTLILVIRINMGSGKLLWFIGLGVFSVPWHVYTRWSCEWGSFTCQYGDFITK